MASVNVYFFDSVSFSYLRENGRNISEAMLVKQQNVYGNSRYCEKLKQFVSAGENEFPTNNMSSYLWTYIYETRLK